LKRKKEGKEVRRKGKKVGRRRGRKEEEVKVEEEG
jgi:hypothetical protein